MNSDGLAKLYDRLTPRERLPLIVAAAARGDEAERQRLSRSAPTNGFAVPDYFGLAEGLQLLSLLHVAELLNLAATYWHCSGRLKALGRPGRKTVSKDRREQLGGLVRMLAYLFSVKDAAWGRLCSELHIGADVLLRDLPGYETLRVTREAARQDSFTPDEANAWLRREGIPEAEAVTADSEAAGLRETLRWREEWWS